MQVEDIDVSGLSAPAMTFAYFSDAGTYTVATANTMYVEAYDGSAWNGLVHLINLLLDGKLN